MSADTSPISPQRFAAALKDLSVSMLHLKVLEIRNSIAHLQYSNDQLKPFAEGSAAPISSGPAITSQQAHSAQSSEAPDQDCIDAMKENEAVIDRMLERIAIIRLEVEERGVSWTEFQSKEEVEAQQAERDQATAEAAATTNGVAETNGHGSNGSSPWTDGTFQTGTIRNGEVRMDEQAGRPQGQRTGGRLDDEQLRRAMEERMRELEGDEDDGGMHL